MCENFQENFDTPFPIEMSTLKSDNYRQLSPNCTDFHDSLMTSMTALQLISDLPRFYLCLFQYNQMILFQLLNNSLKISQELTELEDFKEHFGLDWIAPHAIRNAPFMYDIYNQF